MLDVTDAEQVRALSDEKPFILLVMHMERRPALSNGFELEDRQGACGVHRGNLEPIRTHATEADVFLETVSPRTDHERASRPNGCGDIADGVGGDRCSFRVRRRHRTGDKTKADRMHELATLHELFSR